MPAATWPQRLLLVAFGLSLVLLLELALRLGGFGGAPPLLKPLLPPGEGTAAGASIHEVNPQVGDLFFHRPGPLGARLVGGHRRELLAVPKPPGTVRIVALGGSAVEGFPLPRNLTSSRFLQAMAQSVLPNLRVEVINLGVTAVASFPVRHFALEALEVAEPDVILLYSGHNEHFGASGVASLQTLGRSVRSMQIVYAGRRTALFQAASKLTRSDPEPDSEVPQHLIEVMAGLPAISPEGKHHRDARRNLVANLEAVIAAAQRRGVPVVLATVASNTRDLAPVASWEEGLDATGREELAARLAAARRLAAREPRAALDELAELAGRHPLHARTAWELARMQDAAEEAEAIEGFRRARDLDALPWRATSGANEALRALGARRGVPVADVEAAFAEASGGAPGWELFYDHVHPSLRGQALLASTFLEAMAEARLLGLEPGALESTPHWHDLAQQLGANPLEHYLVTNKMAQLFHVPPIVTNNQEAGQSLARMVATLERHAGPVERNAIDRWRRASHVVGTSLPISLFGGSSALAAGELDLARAYFAAAASNAYELSDEECAARYLELLTQRAGGALPGTDRRLTEALEAARRVERLDGQPTALLAFALAGLLALAGAQEEAQEYAGRSRAFEAAARPVTRAFLEELRAAEAELGRFTRSGSLQHPERGR